MAKVRRMEATESDYLNPPPLTAAQVERIYGRDAREEARERQFGRAAFESVRRACRKGRGHAMIQSHGWNTL